MVIGNQPAESSKKKWRGIKLGKTQIEFNKRTICGCFLLALIVLSPWVFNLLRYVNLDLVSHVGSFQTAFGLVAGILLAPMPTPENHTPLAFTSAERLLDVHRKSERMRVAVSESLEEAEGHPLLILRLVGIHDGFLEQQEVLRRSMGDWQEISPGVVEGVIKKQESNQKMMDNLSKEFENDQ